MQKIIFNQEIQDSFMAMHELIVKGKYYFLKAIQYKAFSDNQKNELRDRIIELSDSINRHFDEIKYAKVSQYNIEEYEKNERIFMKEKRKEIEALIKACTKRAPVKTKYGSTVVNEKEIDADILFSKIYGTRALEIGQLQNLSRFKEYLLSIESKENGDESIEDKAKTRAIKIDKDLLELKLANFCERIASRNPKNPEIFYKVKTKFENLFSEDVALNIHHERDKVAKLNNNELYLIYDDLLNISILYEIENVFLKLDINPIASIQNDIINFGTIISCESQVSTGNVKAEIPFYKNNDVVGVEKLDDAVGRILEDLELSNLYKNAISRVKKKVEDESNSKFNRQKEMVDEVSRKLDEIL